MSRNATSNAQKPAPESGAGFYNVLFEDSGAAAAFEKADGREADAEERHGGGLGCRGRRKVIADCV
jgi:hypothetical protein